MAQPTNYQKTRNFTDWQAANPNTVFTGADMDQEFDNIEVTLDETLNNLAIIQRDDGELRNESVHPDAFNAAALALIAADWTPRGDWVTATAYAVGDLVEETSASYVCSTAHTSGTFATDHTAGKWVVLSQFLTVGVDVQAYDAELASIAGLVSAADRLPYFTGLGTAALATFTAVARTLIAQATQALMRTTGLGATATVDALITAASAAAARTTLGVSADSALMHLAGNERITDSKTFQEKLNAAETIGGTANAITATFNPAITALVDKMRVNVRATAANTGAATFVPDGLGVVAIKKIDSVSAGLVPLKAGDIQGAEHNLDLVYSAGATAWVLLNPANKTFELILPLSSSGYTADSKVAHAHGLGVIPPAWSVTLRCSTANFGYAAGDETHFATRVSVNTFEHVAGYVNATNIGFVLGSAIYIPDNTGGSRGEGIALATINSANWSVVYRARTTF